MGGVLWTEGSARRIASAGRTVEGGVLHRPQDRRPRRQFRGTLFQVEGTLDGALAAAGAVTSPTTQTLSVHRINSGGTFIDFSSNLVVTNRDANFSASSGDYLIAAYINGEWRPITAGGGTAPGAGLSGDVRLVTTGPYTVVDGDYLILCDPTTGGASFSITLPTGGITEGRTVKIKNVAILALRTVTVTAQATTSATSASALGPGAQVQVVFDPGETPVGACWWFAT